MPRALHAVALLIALSSAAFGQPPRASVAVAMYADAGAYGKGPAMLEEALHKHTEFLVTRVKAADIRAGKLKGFQVLIVPGGTSRTQGTTLGAEGREAIKAFIAGGGTYVGICAGCYLASCQYDWALHVLPVKVVDTPNWERGKATLTLALTPAGKEWLKRPHDEVKSLYHNGPVLEPLADATEKVIPLAVYKEEAVKHGAKPGLMVNTPAIAASRFGHGWVIGVSPHPEQTDGLKDVVPAAIRRTLARPAK